MQKGTLVVWIIVAMVLWAGLSWYWYTCEIHGFCQGSIYNIPGTQNDDIGILQREDSNVSVASVSSARVAKQITIECPQYLTGYIKYGAFSNSSQIQRLEQFLNTYEGEQLPVNGVYETHDVQAVKRFQERYREQVMDPWNMEYPSGEVYKTTRGYINGLYCAYQYQSRN